MKILTEWNRGVKISKRSEFYINFEPRTVDNGIEWLIQRSQSKKLYNSRTTDYWSFEQYTIFQLLRL